MEIKRGFVLLVLLLVLPLASAEIIINQQPDSTYNLGDIAMVGVTFKPVQTATGNFQMDLLCGANAVNFYRNGISVTAGAEKVIESSLILQKDIIGEALGSCRIKAYFGSDFVLTNDFLISNSITVNATLPKTEFLPGENIILKGTAIRETGDPSNGFVELGLWSGNSTLASQKATVNNGAFTGNITLPKDLKSGNYGLRAFAYEESLSGETTNNGFFEQIIFVEQVPTSLEIVFEQTGTGNQITIPPGETLRVKAVLHDQSGENIDSLVFLTIKNGNNKIVQQTQLSTDEFLEFPIAYNEAPREWKVVAVSNKLTTETNFLILEKESASVEIQNNTILVTNTGNIPYNETVVVKIGNQSLSLDVYLKVDQSQRWLLTAPDGKYDVSVVSGEETASSSGVFLTGDAIDLRRASAGIGSLTKFPAVWIFIIAVLGVMTFIVFKRGYQRAFIGYITGAPKRSSDLMATAGADSFGIIPKSKAEMVLSIKGDKQEVSLLTLKVKNMAWIKNVKEGTNATEAIDKIIDFAADNRAAVYDNGDNIFLIFAPARTKTFRNEEAALKTARKIKEMLDHHNKMFKQKIDFGISMNLGEIVAKQDSDSFKFMGLGNLMTTSKKIASLAENDVFMSEKIADRLKPMVRAEKHEREGTKVYSIKEVKDYEKHEKFLKGFMKRQDEGK